MNMSSSMLGGDSEVSAMSEDGSLPSPEKRLTLKLKTGAITNT